MLSFYYTVIETEKKIIFFIRFEREKRARTELISKYTQHGNNNCLHTHKSTWRHLIENQIAKEEEEDDDFYF